MITRKVDKVQQMLNMYTAERSDVLGCAMYINDCSTICATVSDCVWWNDEVGVGLYAALNNRRALKLEGVKKKKE